MNSLIWDITIDLFITITTILTANYFFCLFEKKQTLNITLILFNIISFAIFFAAQYLDIIVIKIPILIICTLIIAFNYKLKIYNKILLTIVFIALNGLIELITTISMSILFKVDVDVTMNGVLLAFGALISKLLISTALLIFTSVKKRALMGTFKLQWIPLYILPIATFLVTHSLYYSIQFNPNNLILRNLSLFSLILLISSNMLVFKIINSIYDSLIDQNELLTAKEIIKNQKKQYKLVIENNDKIIKIRHDHKNFIVGILSMIKNNEMESVLQILNDQLNSLNNKINTSICGDSVIDSLINYKRSEALKNNINIEFEYRNVSNINISGTDISILLGNAIDNAIEALEGSNNIKDKIINVRMFCRHSQYIITVSNQVENPVNVENLKTHKGDMHGYGIISMKEVAKKYNGDIIFSCDSLIFKTIIILNGQASCE